MLLSMTLTLTEKFCFHHGWTHKIGSFVNSHLFLNLSVSMASITAEENLYASDDESEQKEQSNPKDEQLRFEEDFQGELKVVASMLAKVNEAMEQDDALFDRKDAKVTRQLQSLSFEELESEFGNPVQVVYPEFPESAASQNIVKKLCTDKRTVDTILKNVYQKNSRLRNECKTIRQVFFQKLRCQKYLMDAANRKIEWLDEIRQKRLSERNKRITE